MLSSARPAGEKKEFFSGADSGRAAPQDTVATRARGRSASAGRVRTRAACHPSVEDRIARQRLTLGAVNLVLMARASPNGDDRGSKGDDQ